MITARTLYNLADKADLESPVTVDGEEIAEVGLFYDEVENCTRLEIRTKKMTEQPAS